MFQISIKHWPVFELNNWAVSELEYGNRVKASKIMKAFNKMRMKLPRDLQLRLDNMILCRDLEKLKFKLKTPKNLLNIY